MLNRHWRLCAASTVLTISALVALSACGSSGSSNGAAAGSADKSVPLKIAVGGDLAIYWHIYVGEQEGIFKKNHLDVSTVAPRTGSSTDILNLVLSGSADMADGLPDPVLAAAAHGTEVKVLNYDAPIAYAVVASKDAKSYADLPANFKVAVSSPTTSIAAFSRLVLNNAKVAQNRYQFVTSGGTDARLAALEGNSAQVGVLSQPADFKAKADGLNILGYTVSQAPWYGITETVKASALTDSTTCTALKRYFTSLGEINKFLTDPSNKDAVIKALVDFGKNTQSDAESAYTLYIEQHAMMGINDPTETLKKTSDLLHDLGTDVPSDPGSLVSSDCTK